MFNRRLLVGISVGLVLVAASAVLVAASHSLTVKLRDDCDPKTFDAKLGAGACVGHGETTFAEFLAEFQEDHRVDDWEMSPDESMVQAGATVRVSNRGGETHTFTRVAKFGAGFVPLLNAPGLPPAPECSASGLLFVPPGATVNGPTAGTPDLPSGKITKFQCCIHPWMHTEIAAR